MDRKIAIVGLGYVGLPLALGVAKKFSGAVGFDISKSKVQAIQDGKDPTNEGLEEQIKSSNLSVTSDLKDIKVCDFYIVGVPTPIDDYKKPDLYPLQSACRMVGEVLSEGNIVVFESTVYPGVTEEICGPILEECSNLKRGKDFKVGYSPERINPGDKVHTLENIVKVVSGEDAETLEIISKIYGEVVSVGIHQAPSIKVAEAAKVIENTQRDLNIALMNELAMIFDLMDINTSEVLAAAGTKWNFLKFYPGLVGGHCIGVDPYYLTSRAQQLGYRPEIINAGRRINDGMGKFFAQKMVKLMVHQGLQIKQATVGLFGITFKENISDVRNSKVPDIIKELEEFGVKCLVHDPLANPNEIHKAYGISLCTFEQLTNLDGIVLAVMHDFYSELNASAFAEKLNSPGVFLDIKSMLDPAAFTNGVSYWSP